MSLDFITQFILYLNFLDYSILVLQQDDGYVTVYTTTEGWTGPEEEALLDAVEQFGFGNWEGAAGHVKTKTADGKEAVV